MTRKYIENPKTKGSGIICCIPQTGTCPNKCEDCFFQSGRSYLEPLDENLPNMPPIKLAKNYVVRVNDGNDSNVNRQLVMKSVKKYPHKFYNTAIPHDLGGFDAPVALTLNPGQMTDRNFFVHASPVAPPNLMFVRFRVNTWNLNLCDLAVAHYRALEVPVILTFMAYYTESIPDAAKEDYEFRKRTLNSYWVITPKAWDKVKERYAKNRYVYTCGQDADTHACRFCGNCLREYFVTMERMREKK